MNASQAWQATLGQLQMEMSKAAFETWVRDSQLISHEADTFTIGVHNAYACDWLKNRLSSTVTRLLSGMMNQPQAINFVVWQHEGENPGPEKCQDLAVKPNNTPQPQNITINNRYTFDTFVVGGNNRLSHAASLAVAENPAKAYNPLFIYGGVGLGKTHLLYAIGNEAHQNGLQVLYSSSEEFTNNLINSIRNHNTTAFRERYRQIDVLLIDDIQFIAGKESTQEEFFHTFNSLHGQNKQIVITSDRPPKALITLEERLCSRFEWGLIVDIQPPDYETRLAILHTKAEQMGHEVPDNILELIARQIQSNIRELEGALIRVVAYADLSGLPLTEQLVETALVDLRPNLKKIDPDTVLQVVSDIFGITKDSMLRRDRSREVAFPRQVAMFLLREEAKISLPQIGEAIGGRDHTTVMHACEKISRIAQQDDGLRRQLVQIRERLYRR
jgi:chromosomal replication initiator protein